MTMQANKDGFNGRLTEVALGYQRMLELNPFHAESLVGMSLVALASRQPQAAVQMAEAAVSAAPMMGTAWVTLGQAMKNAGRNADAEHAYWQAIRLDGMNPLARAGLGELLISTGHAEEAIKEYELALRKDPAMISAHMGVGHALTCLERFEAALARYKQALSLSPRLAEAEFAAGYVLSRLGRVKEAETRYRRALARRPDFAAAWMNLGSLLREQGRDAYAEAALLRAVELRPDLISGWINLAVLERGQKRAEDAEAHLRKAFALNPEQVETLVAWCQFRSGEKDLAGAWQWLRWAQERNPEHSEAMNMKGILLHKEGRFQEAVEAFGLAIKLGSLAAASNRGNSLLDLGRMGEALQSHELAVQLDPTHPGAQYNLALTQLRLGDWAHGWPGYESRWHFREVHRTPRLFRQPRWQGEELEGRRILLHAEQGLGDTIQLCRYVPLVAARGGYVMLQVQKPTARLLESLPTLRSGHGETSVLGKKLPDFDIECPLLSLPAVFGATVETVPWHGPYLGADPALAAKKRMQFPNVRPSQKLGEQPLRVGLAWAGNPRYKADQQRSMHLKTLLPLLQMPGITWVSLQKGPAAEQLKELPGNIFVWDGSSQDRDLAETAALATTLDLIISTDTSVAHLAGALGMPVWILLPHLSDWRWMQQIETTPWYPTARLIRQSKPGDWEGVLKRVIGELDELRAVENISVGGTLRAESLVLQPIPA
jgi:tetratricopeptide (TPR) repeat protein